MSELYAKTIELFLKVENLNRQLSDINDYGEASGLRDEFDQLMSDADLQISSLKMRCYRLERRIELNRREAKTDE